MNGVTATIERELYSELGTLAAAYRIESRRHFRPALRDLLEQGARIIEDIRHDYWTMRAISQPEAHALYRRAASILDAVAEWDA